MPKKLIGLGFKSRVGKTTIAKAIAEKYGLIHITSDFIKEDIEEHRNKGVGGIFLQVWTHELSVGNVILKFDDNEWREVMALVDGIRERNPSAVTIIGTTGIYIPLLPEDKGFLQLWGTQYRRKLDKDFWVKKMMEKYENSTNGAIIDTVRFLNEFKAIKERNGVVALVKRVDSEGNEIEIPVSDRHSQHVSEKELEGVTFDKIIYNYEGNLEKTLEEVFAWIDSLWPDETSETPNNSKTLDETLEQDSEIREVVKTSKKRSKDKKQEEQESIW